MKPDLTSRIQTEKARLRSFVGRHVRGLRPDVRRAAAQERVEVARRLASLDRRPAEAALPMPPDDIRYRIVNQPIDEAHFVDMGQQGRASIEAAIEPLGLSIEKMSRVLDWGAGCGRFVREFADLFDTVDFVGSDIDAPMIDWARTNIPGATFMVNAHDPPLDFGDDEFDLIYGASVMTHLDEERQASWLVELNRIVKPGGVMLLSTQGEFSFEFSKASLPAEAVEEFYESGYTFVENITDGVLPDWYQTSMQTAERVRGHFSQYVEVVDHIPHGMCGYQDLVVCRKKQ